MCQWTMVQMTSSVNSVSDHVKRGTSLLINIQVGLELIIDVEPGPIFLFLDAI